MAEVPAYSLKDGKKSWQCKAESCVFTFFVVKQPSPVQAEEAGLEGKNKEKI